MNTTQIGLGALLSFVLVAVAMSFVAAIYICALGAVAWMAHRAALNPRASRHVFGLESRVLSLATREA